MVPIPPASTVIAVNPFSRKCKKTHGSLLFGTCPWCGTEIRSGKAIFLDSIHGTSRLVQDILANIDIVEFMSDRLQVNQVGKRHVAYCPWHEDEIPSLTIDAKRQRWSCWVCQKHGDIISFLACYERIETNAAIQILAKMVDK